MTMLKFTTRTLLTCLIGLFLFEAVAVYDYFFHRIFQQGECKWFSSWSELNNALGNISHQISIIYPYINLVIDPAYHLVLTSELDFTRLLDAFYLNSTANYIVLNFMGVSGLDLAHWPWPASVNNVSFSYFAFEQSKIDFYLNGTLACELECKRNATFSLLDYNSLFSGFLYQVEFRYRNIYPPADQPICPFLFKNSQMTLLLILSQVNSILIDNLWRFKQVNDTATINSTIQQFQIGGYGFSLDTTILHPLVFEQTHQLIIYQSIGSIQKDVFKNFNKLTGLNFELNSLKNFFHKIGMSWTQSLESAYIEICFTNSSSNANWINGPDYTYPDSDFCIFAQYGQQTHIKYLIELANIITCTNTIRWLLYKFLNQSYSFQKYPQTERISKLCFGNKSNVTLNELLRIAEKCYTTQVPNTLYAEYYQVEFIFEFVQNMVIFIAIPAACLLGLFFNTIIIRQVHKNRKDELKDEFYKYMQLNSFFNCLYCFIFLFYPINSCVDTISDLFCSSIRQNYVIQYYKIVFIAYFGESIKLCANISYILMNVNRYMLIGKDGFSPLLEKISKWDMKLVVFLSVFLSLLINIGHIYQYALNKIELHELASNYYIYFYLAYPIVNANAGVLSDTPLYLYFLFYFVINYFMFLIVNTGVEVILVRKLHKELEEKRKKMVLLTSSSSLNQLNQPISFRKRRKQELEAKSEQRAIVMVVANATINFLFRFPELVFLLSTSRQFFPSIRDFFFHTFPSLTQFTDDFTYLFYILTFTTNFLIYYLFNQKFRSTFSKWNHVTKK